MIKNDGIGDLVLASGLIADLVRGFPGGVDLVTCETNREIAEAIPELRQRIYVSRNSLGLNRRLAKLGVRLVLPSWSDRSALRRIRKQTYDVAISLRRYMTQSTLIIMREVVAREKHCAWLFPTNATATMAAEFSLGWQHFRGPAAVLSELDYYRLFVRIALGIETHSGPYLSIAARVNPNNHQTGRIGLVLGGNSANWPVEYWCELAQRLADRALKLVLFGGSDAQALAALITTANGRVENFTGKLTLQQSVPYLAGLDLLIGNDTGFTHFASLVVDRCVIVLGGGTFRRFFPWPEADNQYVIFSAMDCFDCEWQCVHSRRECLHAITVDAVLCYVEDVMRGTAPHVVNLNSQTVTYVAGWRRMPQGDEMMVVLPSGVAGGGHSALPTDPVDLPLGPK